MKILVSALSAVMVCLFMTATATACSCATWADPCVATTQADVVFVGRVTGIDPGSYEPPNRRPSMARFEVTEILQGAVPKDVALLNGGGASCFFGFGAGREYLVYGRYRDGILEAGLCSRTGELAERRHEVEVLPEKRRGTPAPRLAGKIVELRQRVDGTLGGEALPLVGVAVTAQQGTAVRQTVTDAEARGVPLCTAEASRTEPPFIRPTRCAVIKTKMEAGVLGTLIVWRALTGEKHGFRLLGAVILAIVVATVVWNLIP